LSVVLALATTAETLLIAPLVAARTTAETLLVAPLVAARTTAVETVDSVVAHKAVGPLQMIAGVARSLSAGY